MLFDERDFSVFDNSDSKLYFKEILQTYYSQNYRASVVLLYSFVMYDLFNKLQQMANEGDKKAIAKVKEINAMIVDETKYSTVEATIVDFFMENCSLYFKRFIEDIEYLKTCRNKSAHLKVNDNSLYVPKDYQVRMLISSMYDNILSVKAPFIMDLFTIAQSDIEKYTSQSRRIPSVLDEKIINDLTNKYFSRMTYDSLKKSYKTFMKLLIKTNDEEALANSRGLFVFSYSIISYSLKNGYSQIFEEQDITYFSEIELQQLEKNDIRKDALISLMTNFSVIMDTVKSNNEKVFDYLANDVLSNPNNLEKYRLFYPRCSETAFDYFKKTTSLHDPNYIRTIYKSIYSINNFDINEFMVIMVKSIPLYWGVDAADSFTSFLIEYIEEINEETLKLIVKNYNQNNQCFGRSKHEKDAEEINQYLQNKGIDIKIKK